jgi:quercetin dioxygenase-like cupin family protein
MSDTHADRWPPTSPQQPLDLAAFGERLLDEARGMSSRRASKTLTPAAHGRLKQTLVALTAGVRLDEHVANGPATIHVLRGTATMNSQDGSLDLSDGQWAKIPASRHDLHAKDDTIALITVAPAVGGPSDAV